MATYDVEGRLVGEGGMAARALISRTLLTEGGVDAQVQLRAALGGVGGAAGEAERNRPAPANPRVQTVDSTVEWRT